MAWKDVSYVIASKTRTEIVLKLTTPRTPTFLANELKINLANVSRSLTELEKKGIVVCLTPKQRVGKIYSLTNKGKSSVKHIEEMGSTK